MISGITWYDVLGVLPDAPPEDIRAAWQARTAALQPAALAGAAPDVLSAADRARQVVDEAGGVLADPAARASYDEKIGFARPGEGLAPPGRGPSGPDVSLGPGWSEADEESLEPYSDPPSRVVVLDVTGLFFSACLEVSGRLGLHVNPIRLTPHPMPVDGLVVSQTPAPGERAHRNSTLTVQVWHPSEPSPLPAARAVGEFPEDIEVAVVPGRLLAQVEQDPAQLADQPRYVAHHRNHQHRQLRAAPPGFLVDGPLYQQEQARWAIDQEPSGPYPYRGRKASCARTPGFSMR